MTDTPDDNTSGWKRRIINSKSDSEETSESSPPQPACCKPSDNDAEAWPPAEDLPPPDLPPPDALSPKGALPALSAQPAPSRPWFSRPPAEDLPPPDDWDPQSSMSSSRDRFQVPAYRRYPDVRFINLAVEGFEPVEYIGIEKIAGGVPIAPPPPDAPPPPNHPC